MKARYYLYTAMSLLLATPAFAATFDTPATHAILMDVDTGTVLFDKSADAHMPTSSMSKTMTLYLVFEALKTGHLKLDDELTVSERAWKMEGSRMFLKVGSAVKVEDLIRGVAIQSGNDAAVTLAEGLAGSEDVFADRMNVRAKELGMLNSHFMNASGMPVPEHYSTPRDLATLAQHLLKDFPEYYHYFSEKDFTYNKIHQPNRDPLLGKVVGADGIKTGHTDIAGYGLIGSAVQEGHRLILVANGFDSEKTRADEGARLMTWGFRNFESKKVLSAGEKLESAKVWLGVEPEVPLVAEKDLTVILPIDKRNMLKATVNFKGPLQAPVKKDTVVGKVHVEIPDQPAVDINLLAGADVPKLGIWGRVSERLHYLISKKS